jgi:hypothetical protein
MRNGHKNYDTPPIIDEPIKSLLKKLNDEINNTTGDNQEIKKYQYDAVFYLYKYYNIVYQADLDRRKTLLKLDKL